MTNKKRIRTLALLLIFALMMSVFPAISMAVEESDVSASGNVFTDVNEGDWFYDDVMFVYERGLMTGTEEATFSPYLPLTRGMLVTILHRDAGENSGKSASNPFTDVPTDTWFTDAVLWAAANGIVTGHGDGRFGPEDNVTRQDFAVILMRYAAHIGADFVTTPEWIHFADEADIADYAMNAIQTLHKIGVITGIGTDGQGLAIIDPRGNATRAQAAAILHRFIADLTRTWTLQDPEVTSVVEINSAQPDWTGESYETVTIGGTHQVLYRMPMLTGVGPGQIESAYFLMRPTDGAVVPTISLAAMEELWVSYSLDEWWREFFSYPSTWNDVSQYVGEVQEPQQMMTDDGWYGVEVTSLVIDWLDGTRNNVGFALSSDAEVEFYSIESDFSPKLVIHYVDAVETQRHGRFGFELQPPGYGNCLSFALRDIIMIGYFCLIDEVALETAYEEGGLEGALQNVKERVIWYVDQFQDELKISSFRVIDSFNAPINTETEYRIALRIGIGPELGPGGRLDFDYHLMMQLADGTWADKLPFEYARIVPGSHAGFDPGRHPWNLGFTWGLETRRNGFYSSSTVYFAVEKTVDTFTEHREPGEF